MGEEIFFAGRLCLPCFEAAPDAAVLQMKSLEAFAAAADGQATKIIIPSDIQSVAGLAKSITEIVKEG